MRRHPTAPLGAFVIVLLLAATVAATAEEPGSTRPFAPVQDGFQPTASPTIPYHPSRILIQLTPDAAEVADLDIAQEKGAAAAAPRTGIASVDRLCAAAGVERIVRPWVAAKKVNLANELGLGRWYLLETNGARDALALARRFAQDRHVSEATVDWRAYPAAVPGDPLHDLHWGHDNNAQMLSFDWATGSHENGSPVGTVGFDANAEAAWDNGQGYGAASVVIAILDSGVEAGHPDLRQVAGYDYGDNDSNPDDDSASPGHGTACAGVAAAMANNSLGTAGIAGDCSIMPLKVADSQGSMYFSSIQNALYHAADNGADIASMSLGAAISSDSATDAALQYAYNAGVTLLAATGNENASTISYPAINQYVIAVGAASPCGDRKRSSSNSGEVNPGVSTDPNGYTCDGERWWGSNYGTSVQDAAAAVDLIAPTILPTTDLLGSAGYDSGDYSKWFNGTSCATPYAAGVAALVKTGNPSFTPAQIRDRLRSTAADVTSVESGTGWDRYTGYGMIDADAATGGSTPPPDAITVTHPDGGEVLTAGDPVTVAWTSTGTFSTVAIEYSADGGANWAFITSSTANDGAYGWTVPTAATTQGRIRITGGTAQDTGGSFTVQVPQGGDYATLPYATGFEATSLDQFWTTTSSGAGRVLVTTANTPHAGSRHLTMDSATNGTYSQNEAWLHLDLSGEAQVDLAFWWKDFSDETHSQDGVYISDDAGATFVKVQDLNGASYSNNTWNQFSLDLDALAGANGLALSSTFVVKFQQYDNYSITTDGFAFDDVAVTAGAVAGGYATVPYSTGFETGSLDEYWTSASTAVGRVRTSTANTPHSGSWHLTMDSATNGTYCLNEAVLHLDLSSESQVDLGFWWKEFGDETHSQDGVYFSDDDGGSWTKVQDLAGSSTSNNTWASFDLDVDVLAAANGLNLTSTFLVKFQQYDNYGITTDGFAFDDIAVSVGDDGGGGGGTAITAESEPNGATSTADGPVGDGTAVSGTISSSSDDDYFWFDVDTAGNINISVAIGSSADLDWYLYDANGTQVDRGYTVSNPEAGSYNASVGRYYLRVDGYQGATSGYTLTVAGGLAALDEQPEKGEVPTVFAVHPNTPNPFNPSTTIAFDLPRQGPVRLSIFDQRGRLVRTLVDEVMAPGAKTAVWNGRDDAGRQVHSGVYLYLVEAVGRRETRRMTLVK